MDFWNQKYIDEIRIKHSKYFNFIDELLEFVPTFLPEGRYESENGKAYISANLVFLTKSFKTLRAIKVLCMEGLDSDANVLLRPLLECLINICFMSENEQEKEKKALDYFAFGHMQDLRLKNAIRLNPKLNDMFSHEESERIDDKLEKQTQAMISEMSLKEFKKRSKSSHWSGENIESIARRIDLGAAYDLVFRISSRAIHATDYNDYIRYQREIIINILPGDKRHQEVLNVGICSFLFILHMINEVFACNRDEEIKRFKERFENDFTIES